MEEERVKSGEGGGGMGVFICLSRIRSLQEHQSVLLPKVTRAPQTYPDLDRFISLFFLPLFRLAKKILGPAVSPLLLFADGRPLHFSNNCNAVSDTQR